MKGRRQQSAPAKKITKVEDLVEMGNLEEQEERTRRMKFVAMREEVESDEPDHEARPPESRVMFEGFSRHREKNWPAQSWSPLRRISSSMRSASHCFIIDW